MFLLIRNFLRVASDINAFRSQECKSQPGFEPPISTKLTVSQPFLECFIDLFFLLGSRSGNHFGSPSRCCSVRSHFKQTGAKSHDQICIIKSCYNQERIFFFNLIKFKCYIDIISFKWSRNLFFQAKSF